jgi:hypothetical protein
MCVACNKLQILRRPIHYGLLQCVTLQYVKCVKYYSLNKSTLLHPVLFTYWILKALGDMNLRIRKIPESINMLRSDERKFM